jgi:hypothetical protein
MKRAIFLTLEVLACILVAILFWLAMAKAEGRCLDPAPICDPGERAICVCPNEDSLDCYWICMWIDEIE